MFSAKSYKVSNKLDWDDFLHKTGDDNFLYCRDFIESHRDHSDDCSVIIQNQKGKIVALFPAYLKDKVVSPYYAFDYSEIIYSPDLASEDLVSIFDCLCDHFRQIAARHLIFKARPSVYRPIPSEEDLYALFTAKAQLACRMIRPALNLRQPRLASSPHKDAATRAADAGFRVRPSNDYAAFWPILEQSLREKGHTAPDHSLSEISALAKRFPENIVLLGCFHGDELVAGTVLFRTPQVIQTRYIAAAPNSQNSEALEFLFSSIDEVSTGQAWLDFGPCQNTNAPFTEDRFKFAEGLGAHPVVSDVYEVDLEACRPVRTRFALGDAELLGELPSGIPIRLSICIITYNQRHLLAPLLDEIFAEVGAMEGVEVLVGDDASRDGTQDLLRDYLAKWPGKMRVILGNRNVGICANCNRNLSVAQGDYVALMAGDDRILPGKFIRPMEYLDAHPDVGLCYHDVEVIYLNSSRKPWLFSERHKMRRGDAATVVRYGSFFSAQSVMMRRDLVKLAYMRPDLDFSGDTLFYAEALARTNSRIDFIPESYLRYIRHDANVTVTAVDEINEEKNREMEFLAQLFPQYPTEVTLRHADHEFIIAYRNLMAGKLLKGIRHLYRSLTISKWKLTASHIIWEEGGFRLRNFLRNRLS